MSGVECVQVEYVRAVCVRDSSRVAYAYFHERNLFSPYPGYYFRGPVWIVWFPETSVFTSLTAEQFNELYTLEDALPENMKTVVKAFPSYQEWCAMLYAKRLGPVQ